MGLCRANYGILTGNGSEYRYANPVDAEKFSETILGIGMNEVRAEGANKMIARIRKAAHIRTILMYIKGVKIKREI